MFVQVRIRDSTFVYCRNKTEAVLRTYENEDDR
jgi:hypothetical protein